MTTCQPRYHVRWVERDALLRLSADATPAITGVDIGWHDGWIFGLDGTAPARLTRADAVAWCLALASLAARFPLLMSGRTYEVVEARLGRPVVARWRRLRPGMPQDEVYAQVPTERPARSSAPPGSTRWPTRWWPPSSASARAGRSSSWRSTREALHRDPRLCRWKPPLERTSSYRAFFRDFLPEGGLRWSWRREDVRPISRADAVQIALSQEAPFRAWVEEVP